MQTRQTRALTLIAGLAICLLALPPAYAVDKLARKSGMWEMSVETTIPGQAAPAPTSWQVCIDEKQDDLGAQNAKDMSKPCDKTELKRTGSEIVIDSLCKYEDVTTTGHTVITGDLSSSYRMENTSHFEPAMHGIKTSSSVTTGKWLGPCNTAQSHGGISRPGAGAAGEARMDPATIKRLQQEQGKKH